MASLQEGAPHRGGERCIIKQDVVLRRRGRRMVGNVVGSENLLQALPNVVNIILPSALGGEEHDGGAAYVTRVYCRDVRPAGTPDLF